MDGSETVISKIKRDNPYPKRSSVVKRSAGPARRASRPRAPIVASPTKPGSLEFFGGVDSE